MLNITHRDRIPTSEWFGMREYKIMHQVRKHLMVVGRGVSTESMARRRHLNRANNNLKTMRTEAVFDMWLRDTIRPSISQSVSACQDTHCSKHVTRMHTCMCLILNYFFLANIPQTSRFMLRYGATNKLRVCSTVRAESKGSRRVYSGRVYSKIKTIA